MDRVKFADGATRLISRKSRAATVATALVLLLAVGCVGVLLANRASHLRRELMQNRIMAGLDSPAEKNRLLQILTVPKTANLFMHYIDSLGPAAENLEVTPRQSFLRFRALLDAEESSGAVLAGFEGGADGAWVTARCKGNFDMATLFSASIAGSEVFSKAEILENTASVPEEFTIKCYF